MLCDRINEKLKEFMGDYTDNTLVEYVIVLLKNGRQKIEAKSELDVFLGDGTDPFVSWLWDHLESNLNLYTQSVELHSAKYACKEHAGRAASQPISSEAGNGSSNKLGNNHHRQEMGMVRNEDKSVSLIKKNSRLDAVHAQDEFHESVDRTKRSLSPRSTIRKKRKQTEMLLPKKREISQPNISAPRRLLQFAVRDAVVTSKPPNSMAEPSHKHVRSVVSTSTESSFLKGHPQRIQNVAGSRANLSAAIKAVSDAVKDVTRDMPLRNVFDRLGCATISSNTINHAVEHREGAENGAFFSEREDFPTTGSVLQEANSPTLDDGIDDASDYGYAGEAHDHDHVMGQRGIDMNASGTSMKISNLKPTTYHEVRDSSLVDHRRSLIKSERWLTKEKTNHLVASNGNAKPGMNPQHDSHKTHTEIVFTSIDPPTEDTDSRTVFVSNVHFAASKDSLSRHFNKFGEVLKVNILSDTSTGQPKGSAYIEFMGKEAAELALSLDGTSFMSRILKIVKKASTQPEAEPVIWPHIARPSPFAGRSFGRVPYARGIPSLYRPHIPIKPGARSFQWRRESAVTETSNHGTHSIILSSTPRALTYIRTESK